MSILEQQKQEQKRREQEQQKREQKLRQREQQKLRRASKRARRCSKARPAEAPPKPHQENKDADGEPPDKPLTFLSKQQILARIPVSGPTLWHWSRTGKFPRARFIGNRTVWIADEVDEWMRTRPLRNYKTAGARES